LGVVTTLHVKAAHAVARKHRGSMAKLSVVMQVVVTSAANTILQNRQHTENLFDYLKLTFPQAQPYTATLKTLSVWAASAVLRNELEAVSYTVQSKSDNKFLVNNNSTKKPYRVDMNIPPSQNLCNYIFFCNITSPVVTSWQ
jgi:hypothetical protein